MRAARLHGPRDLQVGAEPEPVPGPGESLVRVDAVGICGSDLHWFLEGGIGTARIERPIVPGHEMGGTIVAGPRAGQRVAIEPAVPCGTCRWCLAAQVNLCPTVGFAGQDDRDGGLRELMTWPDNLLITVPDVIEDVEVPLLEPLLVSLYADQLAPARRGDHVAVVGCGPIGLLQVQVAAMAEPASLLAVEPLAHRRTAALSVGATAAIDALGPGEGEPIHDLVIDASGSPGAVAAAVELARPGGTVVLAGIPDDDTTTFRASTARRKGLTFVLVRRSVPAHERAIRLVETGHVRLAPLISHRLPLEEAPAAFELAARRDGLKVVVEPGRSVA
ncbi:MAG: alcohol dehydrogenase catalytic domain-containing protein [Chloroflexi bacterium]|nr:alcohol dehydrogenase catalytic domain-containing protein [Chloroflexota bacterium]